MRNALGSLIVLAVAILIVIALLPVLGVLFLIVAGVVVLAIGALWAAPLLAKLPWFRDRIRVYRSGGFQSVQFGREFEVREQPPHEEREVHRELGDVIDVQGRELPDADEDAEES